MKPTIGVLYAPGTNCHEETAFAVGYVGGRAEILALFDLLEGRVRLEDYAGLVIPGGFSYGDHVAAGRVLAVQLIARLSEELKAFVASQKPILGICNGNQVLMETGLLPGHEFASKNGRPVTDRNGALVQNRSARFESRLVKLRIHETGSFWTDHLAGSVIRLPVAHGEGRLAGGDFLANRAFTYVDEEGNETMSYPANPPGSPGGIAGLVANDNLQILGLMPHPERAILPAHGSTDGLKIFQALVDQCSWQASLQ